VSHITTAISELERQKIVIDRALSALRALDGSGQAVMGNSGGLGRTKRRLSAEGRRNIIAAAKRRWAELRAAENGAPAKTTAPIKKTKKRVLSAEARKKMSLAAKKRWAAQKKQAA
jgi:hypothetical protein